MKTNAVPFLGKGWRTPLDTIKATAVLQSAERILIPLCTNYCEDHKGIALRAKGNKAVLLTADLIWGIDNMPVCVEEIVITTAGEKYPDFPVIWAGIHPGVRDRLDAREQMALNYLALEDMITRPLQERLGDVVKMFPMEELFSSVIVLAEQEVKKAANAALSTAQQLKNLGKYGYAELGLEKIRQRVLSNWVAYMATVIMIENRRTIVLDPESHLLYWEGLIPFLTETPPLFVPPHRQPLGY